jgi:putative FmdB family regulatory protein
MPTYEYECAKCKKKFEISQSIKDKPITACPDKKCKGKVKRLISFGGGFIFKGPGFYATDNRSSSYKEKAKKDSPSSPCHTCKEGCKN